MADESKKQVSLIFDFESEPHNYLKKFGKSWAKRFKPTKMEELFEAVDIGNFLIALGRDDEALLFLESITKLVAFDKKNMNVWTPTGYGIVLLCRLYRLSNDEPKRKATIETIRTRNFINVSNTDYLKGFVDRHERCLKEAEEDTQKWGCNGLSRHLMGLNYLRETVTEDFFPLELFDLSTLEDLINEGLEALKNKLK